MLVAHFKERPQAKLASSQSRSHKDTINMLAANFKRRPDADAKKRPDANAFGSSFWGKKPRVQKLNENLDMQGYELVTCSAFPTCIYVPTN